jgi:hypothetical protein
VENLNTKLIAILALILSSIALGVAMVPYFNTPKQIVLRVNVYTNNAHVIVVWNNNTFTVYRVYASDGKNTYQFGTLKPQQGNTVELSEFDTSTIENNEYIAYGYVQP